MSELYQFICKSPLSSISANGGKNVASSLISFQALTISGSDSSGSYGNISGSNPFYSGVKVAAQTLATQGAPDTSDINGILWLPNPGPPCDNASTTPYIPAKVTNFSEQLSEHHNVIALAPWTSQNCTLAYLTAATHNSAEALIFYLPDGRDNSPPPGNSEVWNLNNNDSWKSQYSLPVYAISGAIGNHIVSNLSSFAADGILSNGSIQQSPTWIYADIVLESDVQNLPSIWVFLVIVVCCLLSAVGITSLVLNVIQRWNRRDLLRRINRGEVSLDSLGVQRLRVPHEVLMKLPTYPYGKDKAPLNSKPLGDCDKEATNVSVARPLTDTFINMESIQASSTVTRGLYSQPTCPICLDDYEEGSTIVRELPCQHIFHPSCVDTFLMENSSLCPMCKTSVLPTGHLPSTVTNAMVRRDRINRERRRRQIRREASAGLAFPSDAGNMQAGTNRNELMFSAWTRQLLLRHPAAMVRSVSRRPRLPSTESHRGLPTLNSVVGEEVSATPLEVMSHDAPASENRNEWARNRAIAMLGERTDVTAEDEETETGARIPRWRKTFHTLFPRAG